MDGIYNVLTLHVVVNDVTSGQAEELKKEVRHLLQHLNVAHTTIEIETPGNHCETEEH